MVMDRVPRTQSSAPVAWMPCRVGWANRVQSKGAPGCYGVLPYTVQM